MTFKIGTPHSRNAGYFVNDKALKTRQEDDVQTCKHCQAVIKMREWRKVGGWCSKCNSPLCNNPKCVADTAAMGCVPFTRKIAEAFEAGEKLRQHLKIAGLDAPVPPPSPIYTGITSRG
jgi:hypothetical protein